MPDAPAGRRPKPELERVYWTVDGKPVDLREDWSFNVVANGGYDQFRGAIPERQARRITGLGQGALVRGYVDGGNRVYYGRLAAPRRITDGYASLAASGPMVEAEKYADRLLFMTRDQRGLRQIDADPHQYAVSELFEMPRPGVWKLPAVAFANNDRQGWAYWAQGATITRAAWTFKQSAAQATFDFVLRRATGPAGTRTTDQTWALTPTLEGTAVDEAIASAEDMVTFEIVATGAVTPGAVRKLWLQNLRLYGIATSDTYYGYQVLTYLASLFGWDDAGVATSTLNVLPLDHQGQAADLADYVASLEDRRWLALDDRGAGVFLEYDDFDVREWVGYTDGDVDVQGLAEQEKFNEVIVRWQTPDGSWQEVSATASVPELDDEGITNTHTEELRDPTNSSTQAATIAQTIVDRLSSERHAGPVEVRHAYLNGRHAPRELKPDTFRFPDFAPAESRTLRILEVQQRLDSVRIGIEAPASAGAHIARGGQRKRPGYPVPRVKKGRPGPY